MCSNTEAAVARKGRKRRQDVYHTDQVLFLPTTNWLTNIPSQPQIGSQTYHQMAFDDMFMSQFVVGRKRT